MQDERMLPVKLSPREAEERAKALADTVERLDDVQRRKNDAMSGFKDELEAWTNEQQRLARIVESGEEKRPVICEWTDDFARKIRTMVRLDTGEVVESRTMTSDELQREMFS